MPEPGDMSVCIGCGEVLQFDERLRLVPMKASQIAALLPDEAAELRKVQTVVRAFLACGSRVSGDALVTRRRMQ